MSLIAFNNKVGEFEKSVKRSKVRSIRKLTKKIEVEKKKNPEDEKSKRKIDRLIQEIQIIKKLKNKDVVLFAMENQGTISELLRQFKPTNEDLKQHSMIRLATEKSLQNDLKKFKESEEFSQNWRPLLIMYQSRYEKRKSWKEKEADFEKIEKLLKEQENELNEIEKKLPAPIKVKAKKEEKKKSRSKESVVYLLDLETKTAEPFGNENVEEENVEEEKIEEEKIEAKIEEKEEVQSKEKSSLVRDPFFLSDRHRIQEQKRANRQNDDEQIDDQRFIEQSFFINALSSSSNRRDGKGELARKKWAHLDLPRRTTNKSQSSNKIKDRTSNDDEKPIHPSWEASRQAKKSCRIQPVQAKKVVFNDSGNEDN